MLDGMTIPWEQPPSVAANVYLGEHPGVSAAEILIACTENPGRWARISSHETRNSAKQTRNRHRTKFPDHEYSMRSDNGRVVLYARFPDNNA